MLSMKLRQILTGRWGLFRLHQGLSRARHKPCAYVGLSLERNHDQNAMECEGAREEGLVEKRGRFQE